MGIDFRIDDEPRWFISGRGRTYKGIETWEREEVTGHAGDSDGLLSVDHFFESLKGDVDLRVWTQDQQPPLPDEAKKLRVAWPSSGFMRFRERVALTVGIWLPNMWGFRPSAIKIAEQRGLPPGSYGEDYAKWEREQAAWWDAQAGRWEAVDSPLVPFLYHSDCDGSMTAGECRACAPALDDALGKLASVAEWRRRHGFAEHDMGAGTEHQGAATETAFADRDAEGGRALVAMMRACSEYDRRLLFR